MAFKKAQPLPAVPDSPEKILLDLPRRKIPGVLLHQGEIIKAYVSQAADSAKVSDVALQLPTGSGKTLVGLLIGEWRRRKHQERVVYLCPTRQLVNQVVEQADEQYGLTVSGFAGSAAGYSPTAKAQYLNGERMAVTTYSALFNTKPFFEDPNIIIVDDAHAAENYIAALWTVRIDRHNPTHAAIHAAVSSVLKPLLSSTNFSRLLGSRDDLVDVAWVDKIPTPDLALIADELVSVIDAHAAGSDLKYPWSMLRDHLPACQLYVSSQDILLRPLIPPTWTHQPFAGAAQRLFMSATLGAGGDLERLTGRRKILRLPVPEGWNQQGIGRRYFIFPSMSLEGDEVSSLRHKLMERAGRSLVLVPSDRIRSQIVADVADTLGFSVFSAEDIEASKKPFVNAAKAVAVVAGRYDGIDFPGDDCRLLFIDGLPRATNAQERFIMSRMAANVLFNERVQTRVLQAIGRCTRSLQDYSAVVVSGEELPDYLNNRARRSFLHPELQAELEFGIEQSINTGTAELLDNLDIFLKNGKEWEQANEEILVRRAAAVQKPFPAINQLQSVVVHEIEYQERMWQQDYEAALAAAESVLGGLTDADLRGYRALWHYLAGSAAWLGGRAGIASLPAKARLQFASAKEAARGISWLVDLARFQAGPDVEQGSRDAIFGQLERVEAVLAGLGGLHDRQ